MPNANRFWVGISSTSWNNAANWSTTSGGLGGASIPDATDDVYFDSASSVNCSINSSGTCKNISFRGLSGSSNYTGTFTLNAGLTVSGGLIWSPTMTIGATTLTITFNGAGSFNITYNGQSNTSALTFNNASGNWTFTDTVTQQRIVTLTAGNLTFSTSANLTNLTKTSSGTLTASAGTLTYSGTLSNSAGIININGNLSGVTATITGGTVNINGNTVNTTGNVSVSAGTLNVNSTNTSLASVPGVGIVLTNTGTININTDISTNRITATSGLEFTILSGRTVTITGSVNFANPAAPVSGSIQFELGAVTTTSFAGSTIRFTNTNNEQTLFYGGGKVYGTVSFLRGASTGINYVVGDNTIDNLIDTGTAAHTIRFGNSSTNTITTSFNVNGSSSSARIILTNLSNSTASPQFNLLYSGTGSVECNFLDVRNSSGLPYTSGSEEYTWFAFGSITGGATPNVTGWSVVDARYWVGGTGNWNDTNKWALTSNGAGGNSIPNSTRSAIFDANSGTGLVTINVAASCYEFDCSAAPVGLTFSGSNSLSVYDDATLGPSFSTYSNQLIMRCSSGRTIYLNTNNNNLACQVTIYGTGSVILKSNLVTTSFIYHDVGTFDTKFGSTSYDVTCTYYNNSGNITTLNMNNSTFTITSRGASNVSWNAANDNLTLNAGTSSIVFTDSTNNNLEFRGGSKTYNLVHFDRGSSTGVIRAFAQSGTTGNTYNEFKDTGTEAHSIVWSDLPQTFNIFNVNGALNTKRITLNAQGSSNYSFISINPGITFCNNIIVNNCTATPSKKFYANATNSTINTNTTGWNDPRSPLGLLGVG